MTANCVEGVEVVEDKKATLYSLESRIPGDPIPDISREKSVLGPLERLQGASCTGKNCRKFSGCK